MNSKISEIYYTFVNAVKSVTPTFKQQKTALSAILIKRSICVAKTVGKGNLEKEHSEFGFKEVRRIV